VPVEDYYPPSRHVHRVAPEFEPPSHGRPFAVASIIIGAIAFPTQMLLGACCSWIVWPLVGAGIILGIVAVAMRDVPLGLAGIGINVLATIIQIAALVGLMGGLGSMMHSASQP
jgi:hypothetical protein